jgi:hypothetical protein
MSCAFCGEVLVRMEATPINPSDLGLLFGAADMSTARAGGSAERPVIHAQVPEKSLKAMAGRFDQSLPVGNEGAGTVVQAGSAAAAQALLGKKVALMGGAMYTQYRCIPAEQCLRLPDDATPAQGASCFVNPLTALGMVQTMKSEGHSALVHTAAASNLGQMLNRICLQDGVGLVNIVRKQEHGVERREAARVGTGEVAMAVTASTLTSVAVFFPMVFITGIAGQLFRDQSLTVTFALAFSLVVALTLVPMLAAGRPAQAVEPDSHSPTPTRPAGRIERALGVVASGARRLGGWIAAGLRIGHPGFSGWVTTAPTTIASRTAPWPPRAEVT